MNRCDKKQGKKTGRRQVRLLAAFLCLLLGLSAAGCGRETAEQTSALTTYTETEDVFSSTIHIGVSADTPDVSALLAGLPETYTTETFETEKELREAIGEGRLQMAVLTPGAAATEYKKTGAVHLISPVYLGGYRLVGNKSILTIQDPYRPVPGAVQTTPSESTDSTETAADGTGTDGTAVQTAPAAPTSVTVPHDPVEAGEIASDNILPSQLRSGRINVWHDSDTLIDLAKAIWYMDGMSAAPTVIRRYEEETPRDYLTEYNHYAMTNILTAYGGQEAFTNLDSLLDVDAYWEAMTGQPLPSAVLVATDELLKTAAEKGLDAEGILKRDFEAAMAAAGEQSDARMRLVFYGSSNRGDTIMRTYYQQAYSAIGAKGWIPDDAFYQKNKEE